MKCVNVQAEVIRRLLGRMVYGHRAHGVGCFGRCRKWSRAHVRLAHRLESGDWRRRAIPSDGCQRTDPKTRGCEGMSTISAVSCGMGFTDINVESCESRGEYRADVSAVGYDTLCREGSIHSRSRLRRYSQAAPPTPNART